MFSETFAFSAHALVNFIGGGGKTSLIHQLLHEYAARGPALATTTTRLHPPDPQEGLALLASDNLDLLQQALTAIGRDCAEHAYKIIASRYFMSSNLVKGVPPEFFARLERSLFTMVLNEADGAASFSLKLPRPNEPVLAPAADYLVPVIGIDCLGRRLGADTVLRFAELGKEFALRAGEPITPALAAALLLHPRGICRDWQAPTTIIPFINKVDTPAQDALALELAAALRRQDRFPIGRILYGSVLEGRVGVAGEDNAGEDNADTDNVVK